MAKSKVFSESEKAAISAALAKLTDYEKELLGLNSKEIKPKKTLMEEISEGIIEACKPLFDAYPTLDILPYYAWGRNYIYECAGEPFETDQDGWFMLFKYYSIKEVEIDWQLIELIDNEGKVTENDWCSFIVERKKAVQAFDFDDKKGRCIIVKRIDNELVIDCVPCNSAE